MATALFNAPVTWKNQDLVLYHGTTTARAAAIRASGVIPSLGALRTDFGPGFYTTTLLRQAWSWAFIIATASGTSPAVIQLTCRRDDLAALATLAFVRGDYDAEDFWSFVWHCRGGARDHGRPVAGGFFDLVYGPVAAFWAQRSAMHDADQISFHTATAVAAINSMTTLTPP